MIVRTLQASFVVLSVLTTAIMIVVAAWESISLGSGAAGPRPEGSHSEV